MMIEPPGKWWQLRLKELWPFRELLYFLTWRELKVRYKQTALGVLWAVLQPLLIMVLFSVVFGRFANLPSDGFPYPIFTFAGLLPWQLFSRALSDASQSLVNNQQMVSKIYFPRIFLPMSNVLSSLVDFGVAFIILLIMMVSYEITPSWRMLALPIFILAAIACATAAGLWLSAINVKYRDIKYITPFLVQIWLYATPVAYSSSLFPEQWRLLLGLNPMAGVIDGFRWALLGQEMSSNNLILVSMFVTIVFLVSGLIYFQNTEQTFADVI
ncbi:MAG: ABC transporter permease [Anaerolineales bacterium]|nr:MAG: ABC transporter permease [Anaerolineales bacterium]